MSQDGGMLQHLWAGARVLLYGNTGYYNRYYYSWRMIWQIVALFCFIILYRKWKQMGGKHGFRPPPVGPEPDTTPAS